MAVRSRAVCAGRIDLSVGRRADRRLCRAVSPVNGPWCGRGILGGPIGGSAGQFHGVTLRLTSANHVLIINPLFREKLSLHEKVMPAGEHASGVGMAG